MTDIKHMDHNEITFRAYDLAAGDMETALSFTEDFIMRNSVKTDDETLRLYLTDYEEFVDDTNVTYYKGTKIEFTGEDFVVDGLHFGTLEETADFIGTDWEVEE